MLYFAMKPDPMFCKIVEAGLDWESDLLKGADGDEGIIKCYSRCIQSAFNIKELQSVIEKLLEAHRSEVLYDLTNYHWFILHDILLSTTTVHNEEMGEHGAFSDMEVGRIDFYHMTDIYFWDFDFLIPMDWLDNMPMEDKKVMGLDEETFGVVSGLKPHLSEIQLTEITLSPDKCWEIPDDEFLYGEDSPYYGSYE